MINSRKVPLSLHIKDPEVHRLAKALQEETGETLTGAVREALRECYEQLHRRRAKAPVEELLALAKRAATYAKRPYLEHGDLLYDEEGLPK